MDFDGKFWKSGDVFLSLRNQSMILLYRPSTNKIIWKGTGPFFRQHDVDVLNDHKISIFNKLLLPVLILNFALSQDDFSDDLNQGNDVSETVTLSGVVKDSVATG